MDGYIANLLCNFDVSGAVPTPATERLFKIDSDSPLFSQTYREEFRHRVAVLMHLAKRARPELLQAITFLAERVSVATEDDWERVLRYINSTKDLGLRLTARDGLLVNAYVDAAYGVHADGKSHTGATVQIGAGAVHSKSSK